MLPEKVLMITHINYLNNKEIHGPYHNLLGYFKERNVKADYIFHPLNDGLYSFYGNKEASQKESFKLTSYLYLNYLLEIFINLKIVLGTNYPLIIAVDPLNCFACALLKPIKKFKLIYFSPDYADKRFDNIFLNRIYHLLDEFSLYSADYLWAVSTRIIKKRAQQTSKMVYLIPNSPLTYFIQKTDKFNDQIVLVTTISESINLDLIISTISELVSLMPSIVLVIIGDGPLKSHLEEKVIKGNLKDNVLLKGALDHKTTLEIVARSRIGLAIYSGKSSWNYYGDSMKAREYAARATPIIMNDIPSTADDIASFNAGIILDRECNGLKDAILRLFYDRDFYDKCIDGCIQFSKEYDYIARVDLAIRDLHI